MNIGTTYVNLGEISQITAPANISIRVQGVEATIVTGEIWGFTNGCGDIEARALTGTVEVNVQA